MIRYEIKLPAITNPGLDAELAELHRRVTEIDPTWLGRAKERTDIFEKKGTYSEEFGKCNPIWSAIKGIYIDLQKSKCAYCETILRPPKDDGNIVQDVEHFRPKNSVKPWPPDTCKIRHCKIRPYSQSVRVTDQRSGNVLKISVGIGDKATVEKGLARAVPAS